MDMGLAPKQAKLEVQLININPALPKKISTLFTFHLLIDFG
jgi:hypothetical protein